MTHHTENRSHLTARSQRETRRHNIVRRANVPMLMVASAMSVAVLGGCAKHSKDHFTVGSVPANYKERHPIVMREKEQTLDVVVGASGGPLSNSTRNEVQGFSRAFLGAASGSMTVMLPSGSPNEASARRSLQDILDVVREAGVASNRIAVVTYHAGEHGAHAPVRLSYGALGATVEGCGKWKEDLSVHSENRNYHNFGCATQSNLAAMIANPADLNGPRAVSGTDAARRQKVIKDYRGAVETASEKPSFEKILSNY